MANNCSIWRENAADQHQGVAPLKVVVMAAAPPSVRRKFSKVFHFFKAFSTFGKRRKLFSNSLENQQSAAGCSSPNRQDFTDFPAAVAWKLYTYLRKVTMTVHTRKHRATPKTPEQLITEAEQRHAEVLDDIQRALQSINRRLVRLQSLISESQYNRPGSLTLTLKSCGKQCLGCPHPQWYRWCSRMPRRKNFQGSSISRLSDDRSAYFAVSTTEPLRIISHSFVAKDHTAAMLVAEAVRLLKLRSRLVKLLSTARTMVRKLKESHSLD